MNSHPTDDTGADSGGRTSDAGDRTSHSGDRTSDTGAPTSAAGARTTAAAGPPVILGVAGGSGSGKTTVVRRLIRALGGRHDVAVLHHDAYYRDASHLPPEERVQINYDHPDSLETELLIEHLRTLLDGGAAEVPIYDFANHVRTDRTETVRSRPVIILDGILILWDRRLRELMDVKIFVDADADVRLGRRLRRDMEERGRSPDSVLTQYMDTVRPMHLEFVEPSKRYADVIIPRGGHNRVGVDMVVATVREALAG